MSACALSTFARVCFRPAPRLAAARPPARDLAQLTMTILLAILILIDYMFLDDSHFIFDPSIQVRSVRACGAGEFAPTRLTSLLLYRLIPPSHSLPLRPLPPPSELCATNGAAELTQCLPQDRHTLIIIA